MGSPIDDGGQYPFITFFTPPRLSGQFLLLGWRAREPVWRLEHPYSNRDARDERANRRTEHGE